MKKKKFWNIVLSYSLIPYLICAIFLFAFSGYFSSIICSILDITEDEALYQLVNYTVNIGLAALFLWTFFTSVRSQRYHILTGRFYSRDHADFQKSYSALLSFFTHNDPYKMDIESLPIADWHDSDGIILCKYKDKYGQYRLVKRNSGAPGNLLCVGLPGSGKSTAQAAPSSLRFNADLGGCGVFAISIKGDLLSFVNGKRKNIKVFTPDKVKGSCHYDPLLGVQKMTWTERRVFAENMALIICPDESGDNSAYFVSGARDYLTAIILLLLHLHDTGERSGTLKFPEITDMVLKSGTNAEDLAQAIQSFENPIPGEYTNGHIGENPKNLAGIWGHLAKCIRPFNSGALRVLFDGQGDCIAPEDLNNSDIYIDVPQAKYDVYAPAMAIIVTNFLQAFMQRPDVASGETVTPILFLLDEAVQLNLNYQILSKAMSTLRSKKVSLFLLFQSIAQLQGRYGKEHAREIIDLCAYISVFNAQDPESREYFQKLVGKRKMLKRSTSLSSSANKNDTSGISVSETNEFIFEAADFGDLNLKNMKTGKTTHRVLVYANGKYILGETTPCYE